MTLTPIPTQSTFRLIYEKKFFRNIENKQKFTVLQQIYRFDQTVNNFIDFTSPSLKKKNIIYFKSSINYANHHNSKSCIRISLNVVDLLLINSLEPLINIIKSAISVRLASVKDVQIHLNSTKNMNFPKLSKSFKIT